MTDLFLKLSSDSSSQVLENIVSLYKKQGFVITHYLYFANLVSNGIISNFTRNIPFFQALEKGDFLLPDGIALQLYTKKYYQKELPNLNGTDFSEYIFQTLPKESLRVILYGGGEEVIFRAKEYLESKYGVEIFSAQHGYAPFDFSVLEGLPQDDKINIFMVGLGTPKQEIWVEAQRENIQKYRLATFTQGGTFDFWAGNEVRAPKIFLFLKLEWFWRFLTNPKKNFKKVYYSLFLFYFLGKK